MPPPTAEVGVHGETGSILYDAAHRSNGRPPREYQDCTSAHVSAQPSRTNDLLAKRRHGTGHRASQIAVSDALPADGIDDALDQRAIDTAQPENRLDLLRCRQASRSGVRHGGDDLEQGLVHRLADRRREGSCSVGAEPSASAHPSATATLARSPSTSSDTSKGRGWRAPSGAPTNALMTLAFMIRPADWRSGDCADGQAPRRPRRRRCRYWPPA